MSKFEIRELTTSDWENYKKVRLDSLLDSPDSFCSTYEREAAFSHADWQSRLKAQPGLNVSFPLLAEIHGEPVGLASGVIWDEEPTVTHVYQMWVMPKARGMGIAKSLLDRITMWAESKGCGLMKLSVTTTNGAAVSLYKSAGFAVSGMLEPLREGAALEIQPMEKKLVNAV